MTNINPLSPLETEKLAQNNRIKRIRQRHTLLKKRVDNCVVDVEIHRPCHACPAYDHKGICEVTHEQCNVPAYKHTKCNIYEAFVKPYIRAYSKIREIKVQDELNRGSCL